MYFLSVGFVKSNTIDDTERDSIILLDLIAGVAELVDAPDSKSGFLWKWEFESPRPHHLMD